ncbi:DNA adenine methylase [Clostridium butyricum 60E.3]|uniref:DNA adenine methylase n=1 Tax=Clostridium TaxID=1485 RepID=UPI0002D16971|nr:MULTISPECIES: Dam family site-specific DNA-(adenine-N6)-methyltransferase [Clostridium]ENZ32832.1 DNA adenine methylase [Clostridium butyricum 60E.3]MDB2136769.1 Dam family site-specific DNA-(adenine-N6)-methyltransferase [Clostridium butyricum]MDU1231706.1 Dam family site-specific DNA-(adenine-N6)-methyltransferase [Clostridium sp.]MDU1336980.1 Dam family site-specific DNA-(adenine-N6)-methyltransferase [Clostridium butyricum]MDU3090508.1 Dam family site-specific DNA-(adenine-N6)-methyltra
MLSPPICRVGGKSKLRKTILGMIPKHTCYIELFFGAGWVYFGKETSKIEVVNDIDKELINLFRTIKYHAPEIDRLLEYEFSGRDIFEEYKNCTLEYMTEIHRAIRFLYLITQSFGGKGNNYGYGTTTRPGQQIFYNDMLLKLRDRLKNTYVENLSFEKIIDKYDREHSFFFCDPPYIETCDYGNKFKEEEHRELSDKLKNLKGKFLLTINDHPLSRELYKDFNIKEVQVNYSVSKEAKARGKYNELIITNY